MHMLSSLWRWFYGESEGREGERGEEKEAEVRESECWRGENKEWTKENGEKIETRAGRGRKMRLR